MWFKFKNVATLIIETFHLLLLTVLLGNPLNVKHIDDIVVMASTAKTTLASIIANSDVGSRTTTITPATTTTTLSSLAISRPEAPTPPLALFLLETTSAYNLSFQTTIPERSDSNEIDSLNDDTANEDRRVLLKNYVMTKHIALSKSPTEVTTSKALATMTTKLISTKQITHPTTTMNPGLLAISRTTTKSSSSAAASNIDHSNFFFNRTQLDVLSSLSLLAFNDTTTELKSSASATSSSASTSTLTFSNHAATALRHQGNEQNMHNTNSHLTVDNVNATIVSSGIAVKIKTTTTTTTTPTKTLAHTAKNSSNNSASSSSSSSSSSSRSVKNNGGSSFSPAPRGNSSSVNTGITRISARKVDSKYFLSKSHKTDAPMLNYIFDTFSSANKHHHHDQRYGPHFEDVELVGQPTNMTVQAGSSIHLNCRISLLQDKTVSWVRRNAQGENALDLLTVGLHAYTGDKRYKMEFQYPSNWRLKINNVKKDDEATYECQISTHPPRVIQINLHVNAPKVMIVDEFGDPLQEKYYEQDSTLQLSCIVRNVAMSSSVVYWKHIEDILNYDVTRGGISVKTELMDDGANSTLFIAKINKVDSGNYTCSISEYQNYTIVVHILNGESFAELHHGSAIGWHQLNHQTRIINLLLATILLLLLSAYIHR